jgi:hypothetical protein
VDTIRSTKIAIARAGKLVNSESQAGIVSQKLKESIGTVAALDLAQNRNVFLAKPDGD